MFKRGGWHVQPIPIGGATASWQLQCRRDAGVVRGPHAVGLRRAIARSGSEQRGVPDIEIPPEEDVVDPLEQRRGHVTEVGVLTAGEAVGSGVLRCPRVAEALTAEQ